MKASQAKGKDRILAQIKAFTPHQKIAGLDKHLPELERDGLVVVWRDEQKGIISIRLSQKGKDFLKSGGCKAQKRAHCKYLACQMSKATFKWATGIVATVIASWIAWRLFGTA